MSLNLKLLIVSEYQIKETILLMDIPKIGQKKFLSLQKVKTQSTNIRN